MSHPSGKRPKQIHQLPYPPAKSYFSQVEGMDACWKFVYSSLLPKLSFLGEELKHIQLGLH